MASTTSSNLGRPRFLIEQPELRAARGLLPRQVMTYNVRVEGGGYHDTHTHTHGTRHRHGMRKRYSDFIQLRRQLVARYGREGLLVPPLPPKNSGATQDGDFVKRRMSGLALFLEALAVSPFFAVDASVERFMTTTTEGNGTIGGGGGGGGSMDLDEEALLGALDGSAGGGRAASLSSSSSSSSSSAANRGYQLWHEHLAGFANPPQPDAQLAQIRNELDVAERGLREALGASKALAHGLAAHASALQTFSQALHVAAAGERSVTALNDTQAAAAAAAVEGGEEPGATTLSSSSATAVADEAGPSVPELVTETAGLYSAVSPGYAAARDQLGHVFDEIVEHELGSLQALKELLQGREELVAGLLKLQRRVAAQQQQHRRDPGRAAELEILQAQLGREEVSAYKHTKAILRVSVPDAARARRRNLRRAFSHLAAITTAPAAVALNASLAYLAAQGLTPDGVVEEANDAAAALVLPPVPAIALPHTTAPRVPPASGPSSATPAAAKPSTTTTTSTSTAALAAAKPTKPGSFLAEPAPIPSSASASSTEEGGGKAKAMNGASASVVLTLPSAAPRAQKAASVVPAPVSGGKSKAPWESDDEADDPFTPKAAASDLQGEGLVRRDGSEA